MTKNLSLALLGLFLFHIVYPQNGYSDYKRQTARINSLVSAYPQFVSVKSTGRTAGGKDIFMISIGSGEKHKKPAIAVVGGVDGNHLLGMELAIGFAENLLKAANTDSIRQVLAKTTFYVFPNMSPDAMEQYFAPLRFERRGNTTATDDDRDGRVNEDDYEDLDNNGRITWMRVASPAGNHIAHPEDARVLVKADAGKGEKGKYLVFSEGRDNDKDGEFNEDGAGGVWFNKNLSYKHPSFSQGSGEFPVSEPETRAILDELYQLFNVYAVISFSSNNNLSAPFPFNANSVSQRIITGYLEPDAKVNAMVSEMYNRRTKMKDAPKSTPSGGDFLSWAYFHYARFSFSTPGWFVPKTKPDSAKNEKAFTVDDAVAHYLRWSARQGLPDAFTPWKKIDHPDFPGQQVEVGGIDPFVLLNPPFNLVDDLVKSHTSFILDLAGLQPEIDIINLQVEKLGNGISRIRANVVNKGLLPSHSKLGERSYWVKRINVKLEPGANQTVISGMKTQLLPVLEGQASRELSWLVKGSGKITLEAGSPTTGTKKLDITL